MDLERRLETLAAENAVLRDRVRNLEAVLFARETVLPVEWCLTGSEARIFSALVARPVCSKAALMLALYEPGARSDYDDALIESHVSKMRRKLRPFGIEITNNRGLGYRLDGSCRDRFRKMATAPVSEGAAVGSA